MLLLWMMIGCWCARPQDATQAPPRGVSQHASPLPALSEVQVPLSFSLKELEDNLQDQIPPILMEETGREIHKGVLVDWTVSREGAVSLLGRADDQLRLVVPLLIEARAYTARQASRQERRGDTEERGASVTARLTLTADLALDISEDWRLIPVATVHYTWDDPPVLELGPLRLDITRTVDEKLGAFLPVVADRIEARMRERDRLPGRIDELWEQLSTPRPLPRPEGAWLVIEPEDIAISTPRVDGALLRLTARLRGQISTVLGEPPATPIPRLPRRTRREADPGADGLRLQVSVQLSWALLSTQAAAALNGRSWPLVVSGQQAGTFTVTGAELYPSGDSVAVGLNYTIDSALWQTSGTLWLTGHPSLDVEGQSVHIKDFDYAVETWDVAVVGVNLDTVRDLLLQQLDEELSFPFGDQVSDKLTEANAQLSHIELARGGVLTAQLDAASVQQILLTDDALVLLAELHGIARIRLPPPPPWPSD